MDINYTTVLKKFFPKGNQRTTKTMSQRHQQGINLKLNKISDNNNLDLKSWMSFQLKIHLNLVLSFNKL